MIQINGKKKGSLEAHKDITQENLIEEIKNDTSIAELIKDWNKDLDVFRNNRAKYLLYP